MVILFLALLACSALAEVPDTVGFQIGEVKGYTVLNKSGSSTLYQIECPQIQDGRPMKLVELVGTHYEVGYAYGALLAPQILETYDIFLKGQISNPIERHIMEMFLDWQFDSMIVKQIPNDFLQELRGIQNAGFKVHKISRLRNLVERVLVISSYPGDVTKDISYAMLDAFLEKGLRIRNPRLLDYVQDNMFKIAKTIRNFLNKKAIHCSFMAVWGSRTKGGQLYSMRNLDWEQDTGMNKNKFIFVWKVKGTIPHTTIGFPGVIGALTGMSKAGLTVHEAGLGTMKETEMGFQWTLRLRYILMHARNLSEAKQIWLKTQNTFGMNHMVASASDVGSPEGPVFVIETMRNYNAFFKDLDPRQDGTNFTDPKTKKPYRVGYAMKDAVFRTNHGYDPTINKYRTSSVPGPHDSSIYRYFIIKDSINNYGPGKIGELEALNITANVADKGGESDFYRCPKPGKDKGNNIISAMFIPGEQRMYAAVEYGQGPTFRSAGCGVYLNISLASWFSNTQPSEDAAIEVN